MTNRRTLKREIRQICTELFAECVAVSQYGTPNERECADSLMYTIIKMEKNFINRISHPEPGLEPSKYYKDLKEKFKAQAMEIIDQITISD